MRHELLALVICGMATGRPGAPSPWGCWLGIFCRDWLADSPLATLVQCWVGTTLPGLPTACQLAASWAAAAHACQLAASWAAAAHACHPSFSAWAHCMPPRGGCCASRSLDSRLLLGMRLDGGGTADRCSRRPSSWHAPVLSLLPCSCALQGVRAGECHAAPRPGRCPGAGAQPQAARAEQAQGRAGPHGGAAAGGQQGGRGLRRAAAAGRACHWPLPGCDVCGGEGSFRGLLHLFCVGRPGLKGAVWAGACTGRDSLLWVFPSMRHCASAISVP
jgi:hypothetical protein